MALATNVIATNVTEALGGLIELSPLEGGAKAGSGDDTQNVLWIIVGLTVLMWASWALGTLTEKVGGPALVGEIIVGMILGPAGLRLIPLYFVEVGGPLDIIGTTGLLILVYEGGLTTQLTMFKTHGFQVLALAFTGIIMPVVFAIPVMLAFGFTLLESFASGTVLCSTAIAFTVRLLQDNKILKTHKGQLIIISAVIDDIISLVVLAVLNIIGQRRFDFGSVVRPLWTSGLIFLAALTMKYFLGRLVEDAGQHCLTKYTSGASIPFFNTVVTLFVLAATYGAQLAGSTYLLGTYMAGIVISAIPTAEDAWEHSVGDAIRPWFGRLFFTATVGFAIPLNALIDPSNILSGMVLTAAAILGKFLTGLWSASPRTPGYWILFLQVGSAMVGRGELGFVVAKMALAMGLLSEPSFSACIWALLLATILGPFMFQYFLTYDPPEKKINTDDIEANGNGHVATNGAPKVLLNEKTSLTQSTTTSYQSQQAPPMVKQDSDI